MTILQITSTINGGAGMEVINMHQDLIGLGHDSYVIDRGKYILDKDNKKIVLKGVSLYFGKICRFLNGLLISKLNINKTYSPYNLYERFLCYSASRILSKIPKDPDIIFIKWASNFSNARFIAELKKYTKAKIVLALIDQAPLTGGCHYPNECKQYIIGCGDCPMSSSTYFKHCIKRNFQYKQKYMPQDVLVWVASSGDEEIVSSSLLYKDSRIIKNLLTIDANLFIPSSKKTAKSLWGIHQDKKVILCGSSHINEPRKGIHYLVAAIKKIKYKDFVLLLVGNDIPAGIECNVVHTGYLNQEKLISAYQAADVFVCPSIADSGPLMINQAMMVGTPVVSYPIGVSKDLVHTLETGYLATLCDSDDLAKGVDIILSLSNEKYQEISNNCRKVAVNLYNTENSTSSLDNFLKRIMQC